MYLIKGTLFQKGNAINGNRILWEYRVKNFNLKFHDKKRTLNCRVWVNKINNNILLLNKKKETEKTIQVKVKSEKVFLCLGRASTKISVSRTRSLFNICLWRKVRI